jgi:hypothetical protein
MSKLMLNSRLNIFSVTVLYNLELDSEDYSVLLICMVITIVHFKTGQWSSL